ncbi:MAG: TonB-dependent siderophore receptor, partial [Pseudopedobacter saltans]
STGSYGLTRASIDKYGIIDGNKAFMYRVNGAYQYQNSFQDAGFKKSFFIAPSFRYQPNERLYVDLDFTYNSSEGTNPVAIYLNRTRALIAKDPEALNFDWKRSYTSNDITIKTPTVNARALINYRISKGWTSQTIVSSNTRKSNGFYQYEFMRMSTDDSLQRTFSYQNTVNQNIDVQQNFISDFYIGKFRNRLLVGLDYLRQNVNNDNSPYIVYDTVMGTLGTTKSYGKLFAYNLENRLANTTASSTNNNSHINIFSAYASDVFSITERLLVMASLRVDRYANLGTTNNLTNTMTANSRFNQTAFSPKFGLVYEIIPNQLSAFANYLNGFSNVSPVNQPLPEYSGILKPQHANQYEGGLKLHLISGKLDLTTSYYNIEVNNMSTIMNVEKDNQSYAITVQDGTQRSRGFEFDLTANPISGLNILAGYGYNDSKYVKSAAATQGLRPNSAGPSNLANLWASYRLLNGRIKGLGLGFGGNYISKNYSVNSATIGTFTFPDYVLLNASIFYDISHLHLAVKLNNLTNEHYFTGQTVVSPQMPRNFIATIGYSL